MKGEAEQNMRVFIIQKNETLEPEAYTNLKQAFDYIKKRIYGRNGLVKDGGWTAEFEYQGKKIIYKIIKLDVY